MAPTKYRTADVDGFKVFYREAGLADAPKLLLLHGSRARAACFVTLFGSSPFRFHIVVSDFMGVRSIRHAAARTI